MSIRAKLTGSCDALLLVVVGALQLGAFATLSAGDSQPKEDAGIVTDQAYVEMIVVEAPKISRG